MSDATGAIVGLIALKQVGIFDKFLEDRKNGNGTNGPKEKVDLSYYDLGDRCSSASDGKLLRPGHVCIHGTVQPRI